VEDDPTLAVVRLAPDREVIDAVPDEGSWDLHSEGLVWPVTVSEQAQCPAVLEAVVRGVAVVVRVVEPMSVSTAARFVDELHRAAGTGSPVTSPAPGERLTDEQRRLLGALADGATLAAAAAALGMSVRTASRRLAEARAALGCRTTAEAVVLAARLAPDPGRS
jgi:DNA-binding NarL/FixJ family response regulator